MRTIIAAMFVISLALPAAAQGTIGVVSPPVVSAAFDAATIYGWTFNTNGAAITKVRVYLDCQPFLNASCFDHPVQPYYISFMRPDVVAAYPQYHVPENNGIAVGLWNWSQVTDALHWIYGAVQDTEHGYGVWTQINPICFRKQGLEVGPCR